MPPALSIVVPAYNEARRLPGTLETIGAWLAGRADLDAEVVVVDDGSLDRTAELARSADLGEAGPRVVSYRPNRGKGYAVRRGLLEARAPRALISDADLSTPIGDIDLLTRAMNDRELDLALGSRGLPDSIIPVPQGRLRQAMGKTFNLIIRAATGLPFRDTQCGFKLLRMDTMRPLVEALRVDGFAWDVELCYLAWHGGFGVEEIPVTWRNSPESKVSILSDPLRMLGELWHIRRMWRRDRLPVRKERS